MSAEFVTLEDRFVKPCPEFPNGLWTRRIGNGDWETVAEWCPVVTIDSSIAHLGFKSLISKEERENVANVILAVRLRRFTPRWLINLLCRVTEITVTNANQF